ncbi:hypothetical protein [Flavobacterium sp. H122]|nr:hypothetical protein [Flavobacterium sp. H122]
MKKEINVEKLKKRLQSNLLEFRKYRFAKGKKYKKATIFSKIFN